MSKYFEKNFYRNGNPLSFRLTFTKKKGLKKRENVLT